MLTNNQILDFFRETILLVVSTSMPVVVAAAVIGVVISLVQALTQVQEQTLPFAFKLMAVIVALFSIYESTIATFHRFMIKIFAAIGEASASGGILIS